MAAKSANLYARIEPEVKEQADADLITWYVFRISQSYRAVNHKDVVCCFFIY